MKTILLNMASEVFSLPLPHRRGSVTEPRASASGHSKIVMTLCMSAFAAGAFAQSEDLSGQLLTIKRVYVDKLTGGETAAQMRELLITSLQNAKLFILTDKEEKADVIVRGAAEDLIFTDSFSSSDGLN